MLEGCVGSSRGSEIEFHEDLALARGICLEGRASNDAINRCGTHKSKVGAVIDTCVEGALWCTAHLHAVEKIEIFHSYFEIESLTEVEAFGKSKILIALERVSQVTQNAGFIPRCKPGIGKCSRIKNRKAFIIIIPVNA